MLHTSKIEAHIWERCKGFIFNPQSILDDIARQLGAQPDEDTGSQEQALALALAEKQQEEERLLTVFRRGRITLAAFEAEMDKIDAEKQALQVDIAGLQARHKRQHARVDYLHHSKELLLSWRGDVARIDAENDRQDMQTLIADFVAGIMVYPDRAEVTYRFDQEEESVAYRSTPPPITSRFMSHGSSRAWT